VPWPPASLNRQKNEGRARGRHPNHSGLVPKFEAVDGRSGHLSRSPHRPLITGRAGQLRGIRWHFVVFHAATIGGRERQPPNPKRKPSEVGVAPRRSGAWNERHHIDELALFPNRASNVSNLETSICSAASSGMSACLEMEEPRSRCEVQWGRWLWWRTLPVHSALASPTSSFLGGRQLQHCDSCRANGRSACS
jgi:hypothetical protein